MNQTYIYSIPRSGSTLIFNLLRECGIKTKIGHNYLEICNNVIIPVRDFRDCLISWRMFKDKKEKKVLGLEFFRYIFWLKRNIKELKKYTRSNKNILWLKYELFNDNFDCLFDEFEIFFNIKIEDWKRDYLKEKYKSKNIKKKIDEIETLDNETRFWRNHITNGENLRWKKEIKKKYQRIIYFLLRRDLLSFGYGSDKKVSGLEK